MKNRFFVILVLTAAMAFSPILIAAQQKQQSQPSGESKTLQAKATAQPTTNPSKVLGDSSRLGASKSIEKYPSSTIEQAVLDEINAARKEPQKYIQYLQEYRKLFKGNTVYLPSYLRIETTEGVAAVDEAIEFLNTASGLAPLTFSNGLNKAAAIQLRDLIENSSIGHTGKDGSSLGTRLAKFGTVGSKSGENIAFYTELPRNIVLQFIVDDGVKNRSHRLNLFNPRFKVVGIGFGKGKTGEGLTVVDFADSLNETIGGTSGVREL